MFTTLKTLAAIGLTLGALPAHAAFSPQVFQCQETGGPLSFQILVSPDGLGRIADIHLIEEDRVLQGHIEVTPASNPPQGGEITFESANGGEQSPSAPVKIEVKRYQNLSQRNLLSPRTIPILYRDTGSGGASTPLTCTRQEE